MHRSHRPRMLTPNSSSTSSATSTDRTSATRKYIPSLPQIYQAISVLTCPKVLNQEDGNDLLTETNMTTLQFTIALMVFLIAYALFEVPSNYMLKRLKPSNWIAFLMLSWGAITMGLGGVQSFASVTAVRFLLGVFEAGLFPGLVCKCLVTTIR